MSIISDGMAQIHCELPYMGNAVTFPKKCTQHLQGVLDHGQGFHVFCTFENVKNDSNLGIYSVLSVIEIR